MIHRCRLRGDRVPASVVVKRWDTTGPAGEREVRFFRTFGNDVGLRTPACLHGAVDADAHRGVLVLEDLGDVEQGDCLEPLRPDRAPAVVDEIAGLHARWWRSPVLQEAAWLTVAPRTQREAEWIADRRTRILERFAPRFDAFTRSVLDDAERAHERATRRLAGAPPTLLHADLHLDNFVFDTATGEPVLLDWARCARGPGVVDLGDLLFLALEPEGWDAAIAAYVAGLRSRGVTELDETEVRRQLGGVLLLGFITWTCGLARWEPTGDRERRMVDRGLACALRSATLWRKRDPDLFRF